MNSAEINDLVKRLAAKKIGIADVGTQIDRFTWAIPIEVPDGIRYAKVTIVAAQAKATKTTAAFDFEAAVKNFEESEREKEQKKLDKQIKKTANKQA